jgi:hypothetical protein
MTMIVLHQCGYLWFFKHRQYYERAQPTEELLRVAEKQPLEIHAKCFPYPSNIADSALRLRVDAMSRPKFLIVGDVAERPDAIDFCNRTADGSGY